MENHMVRCNLLLLGIKNNRSDSLKLAGKIALVTGGGRGIGRAISLALANEGATVIVNFFRNRKPAEETRDLIHAAGGTCHIIRANVGDVDKIDLLFNELMQVVDGLDILVSNAASGVLLPAMELEPKHWDWTMDINAKALLFLAQKAAPLMEQRGGGRIISLTSQGSTRVIPNYLTVGSSKAALESITRYLAVELGGKGITVNAISGGFVDTDALTHFPNRDELYEAALKNSPAGRLVSTEDLAKVTAFLCSDDAFMIRGQVIVVDGGESLLLGR